MRLGAALTFLGLSAAWLSGQTRDGSELRERPGSLALGSQASRKKPASTTARMVPVVVRLDVPSVASYRGGIAGLAATSPRARGQARLSVASPEVRAYRSFLQTRTSTLENSLRSAVPRARVTHRLHTVVGGLSLLVPEDEISELSRLPGVAAAYRDELLQTDTLRSPGFLGATTLWSQLGGRGKAGEGIIVANFDSGVWPELDSFADPDPSGRAYPAPPAKWTGTACDFGNTAWNPSDQPFDCNNKLIGAKRIMATYDSIEMVEIRRSSSPLVTMTGTEPIR